MKTENIPSDLRQLRQWCLWKTVVRNGKPDKLPYQLSGDLLAEVRRMQSQVDLAFQQCHTCGEMLDTELAKP